MALRDRARGGARAARSAFAPGSVRCDCGAGERRALQLVELRAAGTPARAAPRPPGAAPAPGSRRAPRCCAPSPLTRDARVQLLERVLQLGAAVLLACRASASARRSSHATSRFISVFSSPQCSVERRDDPAAARLSSAAARPGCRWRAFARSQARLDVLRRRIEGLAERTLVAAAVVLEHRLRRPAPAGSSARSGCSVGTNVAEHAVGGLEIVLGHALHVGERHLAQLVAVQEEQAPVADRGDLRQRAHAAAPVSSCARSKSLSSAVRARSTSSAGDRLALAAPSTVASSAARAGRGRRPSRSCAPKYMKPGSCSWRSAPQAWLARPFCTSARCRRPAGASPRMLHEDVDRRIVGMAAGRHVVERRDDLVVADAAQRHRRARRPASAPAV